MFISLPEDQATAWYSMLNSIFVQYVGIVC